MVKIFKYNKEYPIHDEDEIYKGVIPFSKFHEITYTENPKEANLFYIGQFPEGKKFDLKEYKYFQEGVIDHIVDIEGDWFNSNLNEYTLSNCLLTMNGCKHEYKKYLNNIFVRPTFSKNLMNLLKREPYYEPNYSRSYGFIGFNDPLNIRLQLSHCVSFQDRFILTERWLGSSDDQLHHQNFENVLLDCTFSLCPRGTGVDSVRFLESCFYGRIPVVISDNVCFGHNYHRPFYFQIDPRSDIKECLEEIRKISIAEINTYSKNAVMFFKQMKINYFSNPTNSFLRWVDERNTERFCYEYE